MAFELRSKDRTVTESTKVAKPKNPMNRVNTSSGNSLESKVDKYLGNPTGKSYELSQRINPQETIDALRHSGAGRYTQESIEKKMGGGVIAKIAGIVGSNALGIGHEVSSFSKDSRPFVSKLRESAEDTFNNFVGSIVGANPYASAKSKDNTLISLVKNNVLPDGYVKDERSPATDQNVYFKDNKGNIKPSKYRNK